MVMASTQSSIISNGSSIIPSTHLYNSMNSARTMFAPTMFSRRLRMAHDGLSARLDIVMTLMMMMMMISIMIMIILLLLLLVLLLLLLLLIILMMIIMIIMIMAIIIIIIIRLLSINLTLLLTTILM